MCQNTPFQQEFFMGRGIANVVTCIAPSPHLTPYGPPHFVRPGDAPVSGGRKPRWNRITKVLLETITATLQDNLFSLHPQLRTRKFCHSKRFAVHEPLLPATSAFGLRKRCYSFPYWRNLHLENCCYIIGSW